MTQGRDPLTAALRWVALTLALVITLFPFYWMVNTSLKPTPEVFLSPPTFASANWSFAAYDAVLNGRPLARYLLNSLIVSLGATGIAVSLGTLAAYGFTRFAPSWGYAFILFLIFTKMLPETLLVVPYFQLMANLRLLDTHIALIIAYSSFALPFSVWMLIGFFRSIPREIDEAAIIDGASRLQAFWRVILPLSRPGLVAVSLFTFIVSWNSYLWALVLTTKPEMFVVSVGIANLVGEYRVDWNELMAASTVAVIPVMVLYAFLNRHLVHAITSGAVKA